MNYIPNKIKKELQKYPPERKERFLKYYGKFISSYYFEANMIVFLLFLLVIIIWIAIYWILAYKYSNVTIIIIYSIFYLTPLLFSFKKISYFIEKIGDKVLNRKLNDYSVITREDWKKIKKTDKNLFNILKSIKSQGECYTITLKVAHILKDSNIKIVWLLNEDLNSFNIKLYGHAVLKKENRIYDTAVRDTFDEQEYYHINNSKIFKEIEIEKYGMKELKNDWENFKEFCKINGGKRGIED